jgi:hypothetical protein
MTLKTTNKKAYIQHIHDNTRFYTSGYLWCDVQEPINTYHLSYDVVFKNLWKGLRKKNSYIFVQ